MKLNDTNSLYCPYCGSVQEKESRFCVSCGADLNTNVNETPESESTGIRIIAERPLNSSDYQRLNASAATAAGAGGGFSSRNQSTGSYSTPVYKTPVRTTKKDNANIALILGIIGFFVSCFLIPIIGLHYVNKAEQYREDRSTIQIAKILNWIQLILMIIGTILGFLYFVGFGFWYY